MAMGECDVEVCSRFSADLVYCPIHTPDVDYEIPKDAEEKTGDSTENS